MNIKKRKPKYKVGDMFYRSDKNCYLQVIDVTLPIRGKQEGYLYDLVKVKTKELARYYETKIEQLCVRVDNKDLVKNLYL